MKLINYDYGYLFECCIKGKILVTQDEWQAIKKYLLNPAVKLQDWDAHKRILKNDLQRTIKRNNGKSFLCNVRVSATEKVVKHFGLQKYKRQNYIFEVTA